MSDEEREALRTPHVDLDDVVEMSALQLDELAMMVALKVAQILDHRISAMTRKMVLLEIHKWSTNGEVEGSPAAPPTPVRLPDDADDEEIGF
jgi:hypothetical protein